MFGLLIIILILNLRPSTSTQLLGKAYFILFLAELNVLFNKKFDYSAISAQKITFYSNEKVLFDPKEFNLPMVANKLVCYNSLN